MQFPVGGKKLQVFKNAPNDGARSFVRGADRFRVARCDRGNSDSIVRLREKFLID